MNPKPLTKREGVALFVATALIGKRHDKSRKSKADLMREAFAWADSFLATSELQQAAS